MVPIYGRSRNVDLNGLIIIGPLLLVAFLAYHLDAFVIPTLQCYFGSQVSSTRTHRYQYVFQASSIGGNDDSIPLPVPSGSDTMTSDGRFKRFVVRKRALRVKTNPAAPRNHVKSAPCLNPTVLSMSLHTLIKLHRHLSSTDNEWGASLCLVLGRLLSSIQKINEENVYPLVDTLCYSAILYKKLAESSEPWHDEKAALQRVASAATTLIDQRREKVIRTVRPCRMVEILRAFQQLENHDDIGILPAGTGRGRIQQAIYQKCSLGSSLAQMLPGDMSMALITLSRQSLGDLELTFAIALMRRFRKQAVRQVATVQQLVRAVTIVSTLHDAHYAENSTATTWLLFTNNEDNDQQQHYNKNNNQGIHFLSEAKLMVYTVFRAILKKMTAYKDMDATKSHGPQQQQDYYITLSQLTELVSCVSAMEVLFTEKPCNSKQKGSHPLALKTDWDDALLAQNHNLLGRARVDELSRFLVAVEGTQCLDLVLSREFGHALGQQFLQQVNMGIQQYNHHHAREDCKLDFPLKPKSVNSILRYAIHCWQDNHSEMESFLDAAHALMTHGGFLKHCQADDFANFATFLDKTRYLSAMYNHSKKNEKDPLLSIAERILDKTIAEATTPSQACRILRAFTSVILARGRQRKIGKSETVFYEITSTESFILFDLFQTLGGHLLTDDELSAKDISSALYAYAKASYVHDMGIFDHLTGLMAARMEQFTIRQLSQGLWACGKMALWEQQEHQLDSNDVDVGPAQASNLPPFVPSANLIADFLASHSNQLTPRDVAQIMWALGRLQSVQNLRCAGRSPAMDKFLSRAKILAPELAINEASNILWGMSMTGYKNCELLVRPMADRILYLHASTTEKATPMEASSIMMAFGRMGINGIEELFDVLSNDILDQINVASAQAIANALYAHRAVHITPPQRLLDHWASHKLGLVTVQSDRNLQLTILRAHIEGHGEECC